MRRDIQCVWHALSSHAVKKDTLQLAAGRGAEDDD